MSAMLASVGDFNGWWLGGPAIAFVVVVVLCASPQLSRLVERARMWFRSQ